MVSIRLEMALRAEPSHVCYRAKSPSLSAA
jgi:hypothetical protein